MFNGRKVQKILRIMLILLKLEVIKIKISNLILRRLELFAAPSLISVSRGRDLVRLKIRLKSTCVAKNEKSKEY